MKIKVPSLAEVTLFETEYALSEIFDFGIKTEPKTKYIILSSPRSGSTMLASALYNTGLAGAPFEYFHKNLLKFRDNPEFRPNELNSYLEEMIERRTSPNGYFGMNMQFEQFNYLFGANATATQIGTQFINDFEKCIFFYRRDKIMQSISGLLSREKHLWSKTPTHTFDMDSRSFNPDDALILTELIANYINLDNAWRKILNTRPNQFIEVAYEDLCEHPEREFSKLCVYLGIDNDHTPPQFLTSKILNANIAQDIKDKYLEFIGAPRPRDN